ncbi:glutathione S-transferase [Lindgomyces ingoldianus]|uniref:Glutathione S-transferase n=1 Tax=Lindgomyces ingoldianus TaxID=673940 RepID=A0ACB6QKG3_9PLEO|nr:glutathione S-transferase [Lindgomyces ingoldianus]KAF2467454.1 glutathione S-transferase [Lindgomyces ingoldianus]
MAPFATLHTSTNFLHARVAKTLAAANFNGLDLAVEPGFEYGVTNKTPSYLAKFPMGKIPALETPSGFYLAEATAMAYYVSESGPCSAQLLGRSVEDRALVQMWIAFADSELFFPSQTILAHVLGRKKYDPEAGDEKEAAFERSLKRLELHLAQEGKKWLVRDEEVSLADLSVASSLLWPLNWFMDPEYRKNYPKTMDWWERLMAVESVGKAFGAPVSMCEEKAKMDGSAPPTLG